MSTRIITEMGPAERRPASVPSAIVAQARRAAHAGVALDSVLRRFAAGERLFGELLLDAGGRIPRSVLLDLMRDQALLLDRIMASIAREYEKEREALQPVEDRRLIECVQRLLAGVYVDTSELDYDLDGWHLGLAATGLEAHRAVREIAARLNRQILAVPRREGAVAAWLGGERRITFADIQRACPAEELHGVSLGIGEAERRLEGWRLTHQQARTALSVALRTPHKVARYGDCALLATTLADDTLTQSLRETYLAPLRSGGDSGMTLIETLRAYLSVGCNAATAAHCLGVDRKTVERRIRKIEKRLDRPLRVCHAELEVALRLEQLGDAADR